MLRMPNAAAECSANARDVNAERCGECFHRPFQRARASLSVSGYAPDSNSTPLQDVLAQVSVLDNVLQLLIDGVAVDPETFGPAAIGLEQDVL